MNMNFDVIIIGGGAAGLSAALWCDDLGLSALILESGKTFGGQLLRIYNRIENHLGAKSENGRALLEIFLKQTENRRFFKRLRSEVKEIDTEKRRVFLAGGESLSAKALIVATGVRRRKLNIEGETEFEKKGILVSGKRDKDRVKGKTVIIAGGGDAALENALILSDTAAKVFLVHRRDEFRARPGFIEKVQKAENVEILFDTILVKIGGGRERIETVELQNLKTNELYSLPVDAVLIRVGVEPNTDFLRGKLDLDEKGYVKIDHLCRTSAEGIYAVGDAANPSAPTVSGAVGTGSIAAKTIYSWLND